MKHIRATSPRVANWVKNVGLWLGLSLLASVATAQDDGLVIDLERYRQGAISIAIVPFSWQGTGPKPQAIGGIVSADLERSGRFSPVPVANLPARPDSMSDFDFNLWQGPAGHVVVGQMRRASNGMIEVEYQLGDLAARKRMSGQRWAVPASQLRWLAHHISDLVYQELTGERGAFNTRIAYITERRASDHRIYTLLVADSDGFNPQVVLQRRQPIMSPNWSPDGKFLAYVSFEGGRSAIYVQEVSSGARRKVASFNGHNGAPSWSPDGSLLAMSLSKDGNPEIYTYRLTGGQLRRLTRNEAIDTEPSWAPDGQSIVFTSDRGGQPQVYQVSSAGGAARRVTFDGEYNSGPRYSPDGKKIAYVRGQGGAFRIAVLDLASGSTSVLTSTQLDESPSFAPNGSMILYATNSRRGSVLAAVSVDGSVKQTLVSQRVATREPAWSPFLKVR